MSSNVKTVSGIAVKNCPHCDSDLIHPGYYGNPENAPIRIKGKVRCSRCRFETLSDRIYNNPEDAVLNAVMRWNNAKSRNKTSIVCCKCGSGNTSLYWDIKLNPTRRYPWLTAIICCLDCKSRTYSWDTHNNSEEAIQDAYDKWMLNYE